MKRNIYTSLAISISYLLLFQTCPCDSRSVPTTRTLDTSSSTAPEDLESFRIPVPQNHPKNVQPATTRSLARNAMDRQANVWEIIGTMESYKSESRLFQASNSDGRKTFASFHYKVVPIYWNGRTTSEWVMDTEIIRSQVQEAIDNHSSQSWGKLKITFEIVPQTEHILSWATSFGQGRWGAENILTNMGYTKSVDYDGIIMVYHPLGGSDDYCCSGGKAYLGGMFGVVSYSSSWRTIRHEMGHYFGHYHHMNNHYNYRSSRPYPPSITDGFDMMSGGNGYDRSDFGVASKWYFNWVSDYNIVSLQPEGKTDACPSCLKSGTFTLKPFDDWWRPPGNNDIVGIHIPVMTQYDSYWNSHLIYSYWLSYRTGADGYLKNGLSVHVAWFELDSRSQMGAYYDSMNYDAFGYSDDRRDSAVLVNTCYYISPAPYLLDRDLISANAVQPVVCVDSINEGSDITVSISFIESDKQPSASIDVVERTVSCSTSTPSSNTFVFDARSNNVVHIDGMGKDGEVTVSLKSSAKWSMAYFYDGFPYSPLIYGTDVAYGSMRRLGSAAGASDTPVSMTYSALFGEVYTIIPALPWPPVGSTVTATYSCKATSCFPNQYNANGRCNQCPLDYRANEGATSVLQCWPCPDGTYLSHPFATECTVGQRNTPPPVPPPVATPTAKDDDDYYSYNQSPTKMPSKSSSKSPINMPSKSSSKRPSTNPPTKMPTSKPTKSPSSAPSYSPTKSPTQKPSPSPTPDVNCVENSRAQFLLNVSNGNPVLRTCRWLRRKNSRRQNALCSKSRTFAGFKSAKDVCVETCNVCGAADTAPSNADSNYEKFFLRTKTVSGKTVYVVKPCKWLRRKTDVTIMRICNKAKSKYGIKSAPMVCPTTCSMAV